jgi:hypothetical protein
VSCPNQKFALLGYSQGSFRHLPLFTIFVYTNLTSLIGAAATVDVLKQFSTTSAGGQAVTAVFLIGDPEHEPGKKSNVDQKGGSDTTQATGISGRLPGAGIPDAWD